MTKYSRGSNPKRLLPLQEGIGRVVQALANSSFSKESEAERPRAVAAKLDLTEEVVRSAIWAWQERAFYIPSELLSDPVWGMLLQLLLSEIGGRKVCLSRLLAASAAPTSTAVRWLKAMEDRRLIVRRADPDNSRNEFIELTPETSNALRRYFCDVLRQK